MPAEKTPVVCSKKLLPSPEVEPLKMLSPFATIKRMTPLFKKKAEAYSLLHKIAGKKEPAQHISSATRLPNKKDYNSIARMSKFSKFGHVP